MCMCVLAIAVTRYRIMLFECVIALRPPLFPLLLFFLRLEAN